MLIAPGYPFLEVLWRMSVVLACFSWNWLLITISADVRRRRS